MFRGMGRVYEEFTYSIPNLLLLAVTLPVAHWIQGRWTPFGIGIAASVATVISASILMGRALYVLDLPLAEFLRVVIVPGWAPVAVAGLLAWPVSQAVQAVGRWQGVGVVLAFAMVYAAGCIAVLYRWVLTDEEKNKGRGLVQKGMSMLRGQELAA